MKLKTLKLLKRWFNMINGKSVYHVKQGIGKNFSKSKLKGYYNDMTGKVSNKTKLDNNGIPITTTINGIKAYFPISIFQYGLGLYDLYLDNKDKKNKEMFIKIANWAVENQNKDGMWNCMDTLGDSLHKSQSSMCQSEGVSVLLRAYKETKIKKYLESAERALKILIKPTNKNGTALYEGNDIIFQEYVSNDNLSVLNGWIFSIFGIYDYVILSKNEKYNNILNNSVNKLAISLYKYDRKYWSNYDIKGTIASPAYHDLHIDLLETLYILFGKKEFLEYSMKWKKYQQSTIKKYIAIFVKLKQKIIKNKYYDINTTTFEVKK